MVGTLRGIFVAHKSYSTSAVATFSDPSGISWAHVRLVSLHWCCSSLALYTVVFLLLWYFNCFSSYFTDYCQWHGHSIVYMFPDSLLVLYNHAFMPLSKGVSHFHLQHPFSHHFQFLKLLCHFGFHRNHMSLLTSIFNTRPRCFSTYWPWW